MLRMRPYRLILTDLEMPRMDGFELLAELGRTGVLDATPVVVTSTRADPATRRRVLELGASGLRRQAGLDRRSWPRGAVVARS